MDATSGVPTEGRPQGGDCGLILSPGNNYLFIRVYNNLDEIRPCEIHDDYVYLPKALHNIWDQMEPQMSDPARDALVGAPECGISDNGKYYLASRKTLNCQIVDGGLLFSIKPEYRKK